MIHPEMSDATLAVMIESWLTAYDQGEHVSIDAAANLLETWLRRLRSGEEEHP